MDQTMNILGHYWVPGKQFILGKVVIHNIFKIFSLPICRPQDDHHCSPPQPGLEVTLARPLNKTDEEDEDNVLEEAWDEMKTDEDDDITAAADLSFFQNPGNTQQR